MTDPKLCASCGTEPAGPGAVLCGSRLATIRNADLNEIYTVALKRAAGEG